MKNSDRLVCWARRRCAILLWLLEAGLLSFNINACRARCICERQGLLLAWGGLACLGGVKVHVLLWFLVAHLLGKGRGFCCGGEGWLVGFE